VLVGQKQDAPAACESPLEGRAGVGRGADQAAALAAKGLDGGGRVHVGQRDDLIRKAQALKRFPAGFDLGDFRHVGHGAAGVKVGQDDLLAGVAEHIGALRHEVYAAENNVFGVGFGGDSRELVAVACEVGETDDFVPLIVVPEQDGGRSQALAGLGDAFIHGVVGEGEVVVKAASVFGAAGAVSLRRSRRQIVDYQVHRIPPSVLHTPRGRRTGMLKANAAAVDALATLKVFGVAG